MAELPAVLFKEYMTANATIPQVSDGIKWWVHDAYLTLRPISVADFSRVEFIPDQFTTLKRVATAIHRANNVPWEAVPDKETVAPGITPLGDADFQILMTRVRHSFVNNMFHYLNGEMGGYKNDLEHDLVPPTRGMVFATQVLIDSGEADLYARQLKTVVSCLTSPEGREVLKEYRDEFRQGKRTSAVWRTEGHGSKFAYIVRDAFQNSGFDPSEPQTRLFLQLNNLTQYPAFGGVR